MEVSQPLLLKRKLSRGTEHDGSPERKKARTAVSVSEAKDIRHADMKLKNEQASPRSSEVRSSFNVSVF